MCDLVENYARECAEEAAKEAAKKAAKEAAKKLFENGVSFEQVRASLTTISDVDLKDIYEKVKSGRASEA